MDEAGENVHIFEEVLFFNLREPSTDVWHRVLTSC